MAYETVELQKLLREIAGRTASEQDADAISLAADTLDSIQQKRYGEIVDMKYSEELGTYYGLIRCPACGDEVKVSPMERLPRCACDVEWDFSVAATGTDN